MTEVNHSHDVVLYAPRGRNAAVIMEPLQQTGIHCVNCASPEAFLDQIGREAGLGLVTEEALTPGFTKSLIELLDRQPAWSDLPIVVLTHSGDASRATLLKLGQLERLRNVTFIERPIRMITLLSTINLALQARRRQYDVRDHLRREQESGEAWRVANERKDEFLAMLAHELRNPLAALSGAIEIMRMPDMQEDAQWCQDIIERQVKQLSRLVDDLLDVSRISRGKITLKKEIVSVQEICQRAINAVQPLVEQQQHELISDCELIAIPVEADPARLEQILVNLLTNAAKYTESQGKIWITARTDKNEAVISIRDTGIGIAPDVLPKIFDLFTQEQHAVDRSKGGLGIGLTLVQRLLAMHGGSISATSNIGKGSEFTVRLPLARRGQLSSKSPAGDNLSDAAQRPAGGRVLVVDDNVDAAQSLGRMLSKAGYEVSTAYDGRQAIKAAISIKPQAVLLDIGLPGADGYQVAKILRKEPGLEDVLLIAISGYGQQEDRSHSERVGFDHHLVKPVEMGKVLKVLADANLQASTAPIVTHDSQLPSEPQSASS